jgi:hypothetical protein
MSDIKDSKPNKYTILQGEGGQWQILKRAASGGHWIIYIRNCQSQRLAVLFLNAIIQAEVEDTPEHRIMNAGKD